MFHDFAAAVHARYTALAQHELFTVDIDKEEIKQVYLDAFPPGTNPLYKAKTEHDCSCCKQFIRNLGAVVAIIAGKKVSVWGELGTQPHPYDIVAEKLAAYVHSKPITGLFRTKEGSYGVAQNIQDLGGGEYKTWEHFHGKVLPKHRANEPQQVIGKYNAAHQVFQRGMLEITTAALDAVASLIEQNVLYRGAEFAQSVNEYRTLHAQHKALPDGEARSLFCWANAEHRAARLRNTAIGTLLQDLSEGKELEDAVKAFERMVAPTNYKRTTTLITPSMVNAALAKIKALDLEPALERRFAKLSDISVNDVLWVNNDARAKMRGNIENVLLQAATQGASKNIESKARDVSYAEFIADILPKATGIDLLVRNGQLANFVSLTAPVHNGAQNLFPWRNGFAWSYEGNLTDSIKERVKRAGGNIEAPLRVSLSWFNFDDLDLHCVAPGSKHIYFGNKQGILDVDMNAGGGRTREPVENLAWRSPADGRYRIIVDQFCQRESSDVGFTLELSVNGAEQQFSFSRVVTKQFPAMEFTLKAGKLVELHTHADLVGGSVSKDHWGVKTETFVKVDTITLSPNHWGDNATGNKHTFFFLEGCKNPLPTRGIYNEFLRSDLTEHRKVFEVLGDKTKCPPTDEQLSGMGFSSTRGDTVTLRVAGGKPGLFNVKF